MTAIARRADRSLRRPWTLSVLVALAGGVAALMVMFDGIGLVPVALGALALLGTYATMRAWARALELLRLEVRDGRLVAQTDGVWQRTVSIGTARVLAIEVLDVTPGTYAVPAATLVMRLSPDHTEPLLEPLSREDAETLRELASSALGITPATE